MEIRSARGKQDREEDKDKDEKNRGKMEASDKRCQRQTQTGYSPWGRKELHTTVQVNDNNFLWLDFIPGRIS